MHRPPIDNRNRQAISTLVVLCLSLTGWWVWRSSGVRESLVRPIPQNQKTAHGSLDPESLRAGLKRVRQHLAGCESAVELELLIGADVARVVRAEGECGMEAVVGLEFPATQSRPGTLRVQIEPGSRPGVAE